MYETYYHLKTKPFTLLPDPEFLYLGAKHKMALSLLEYGLSSGSAFIVITGDPGTGKTTLLNRLLDHSGHLWTIGMISHVHAGLGGLMPWIAASFGLQTKDRSQVEVFHDFARFLEQEQSAGKRVLLVLDEAQNLNASMLEEMRLLSNLNDGRRRSLQILLSGQPRFRDLLVAPEMIQLAQRIGVEDALDALAEDEMESYIAHRLHVAGRAVPLFTHLASRIVFRLTGGLPRLVNQVCDHALIYGYAEQADLITARIVLNASAARARLGVLPLAVCPEAIRLSPHELSSEQVEVVSLALKDVPKASANVISSPESPHELCVEQVEVATLTRKDVPQASANVISSPESPHELCVEQVEVVTLAPKDVPQASANVTSSPESLHGRRAEQVEVGTLTPKNVAKANGNRTSFENGKAMAQDPSSTYREGLALKGSKEFRQAIKVFDRLIEQDSWAVRALAQKGLCLIAVGRYEEAITAMRDASTKQSATEDEGKTVQYLLARTLESQGRYGEARTVYVRLNQGQNTYRDVPARLAQLPDAGHVVDSSGHRKGGGLSVFKRGYKQLLRGLQG